MTTTDTELVTNTDIKGLIERVEKATGADREIDALVWLMELGREKRGDFNPSTVFWTYIAGGIAMDGNTPMRFVQRYTASVDAALALMERVLPEMSRALHLTELLAPSGSRRTTVTLMIGSLEITKFSASADTIPLAIILATLRAIDARAQFKQDKGK